MSRNRDTIAEIADDRQVTLSRRVNGRNGHNYPSRLLSWYFGQPRVKGLTYVLTANGYVILSAGLPGSRKGLDTNGLMV